MITATRSGIPTTYRGTNFRSRLEARWAAFFDLVEWRWTYEPFDAGGYIPDFLIHGRRSFFVEVGPCIGLRDYQSKASKADERAAQLRNDMLVVGVSPLAEFDSPLRGSAHPENPVAGWFGECADDPDGLSFAWEAGIWSRCLTCGRLGPVHAEMSFIVRPCSHHQSGGYGGSVDPSLVEDLWAMAGNRVQWQR